MATKRKVQPRVRTGMAGIPMNDFERTKHYIHYELDKKPTIDIVKTWIKKTFSKADAAAIIANPDYHFSMYSHYAAGILWSNAGLEIPEKWSMLPERTKEYYGGLIETGKKIAAEKKQQEEAKGNVVVLTPQQRLWNKVNDTIMFELDELEDEWIDGQTTEFDMYNRMRFHDLKGAAVDQVRRRIDGWLLDYSDAYNKTCEQAVEGYSHIPRKELKRRINVCNTMLADLNKLKAAASATRKTRVKKPRSADKQVARVKYCKESTEHKLVSQHPVVIVGAMRVFTFNIKTRVVTEYMCQSANGFEVKGTTIVGFDPETSRQTRLRKPDEFLPIIQGKTPKQIDNAFQSLSTKINVPNGRLNDDTIIVRALDR